MATIKDLLSNMIAKIHTKMDAPIVTEVDNGKVLGVADGAITLVEQSGGTVEDGVSREEFDQLAEEIDGVGAFVVKVVMDVDNGAALTSDKTYDEIKNAVIDGQDIVCVQYNVVDGAVAVINRYSSVQLTVDVDLEECVVAYDLLNPLNFGMIAGLKFKNSGIEIVKDRDFMLGRSRIYVKGCFLMTSSTPGSKKLFRIEVDDSGVLSATEVPR